MTLAKSHNLRALHAFESIARHLSISKAAEELGVSQSAVSHQQRRLAQELGEKLFFRSGRRIQLTQAGQTLADKLHLAFLQIDQSVTEVIGSDRQVLRLAVCSSFAPGWIAPRLSSFLDAYPNIDLQLRMYAQDPELTDRVADAFVTTLPTEAGFWEMRIQKEVLVPVCADVRYVARKLHLITTDLEPHRLGEDWIRFCSLSGFSIDQIHSGRWLQTSHYITALELARKGLGVALVPEFLAEPYVASGALHLFSHHRMPTGEDYHLCIKTSRHDEKALRALVQWFKKQIGSKDRKQRLNNRQHVDWSSDRSRPVSAMTPVRTNSLGPE